MLASRQVSVLKIEYSLANSHQYNLCVSELYDCPKKVSRDRNVAEYNEV